MHPFMPAAQSITALPEEFQDKALKRLADFLKKVDEVRRATELPVEQLPLVIETYAKVVMTLLAEEEQKKIAARTTRLPITMRSEDRYYDPMKIKPGKDSEGRYFRVIARPQVLAFRPEDIAIHGDRSRWKIHDILVGNRSQFAGRRDVPAPGTEFGPGGVCERLRLETAMTAMDIVLVVEYVGPEIDGEVFEATMVGTATEV